MKIGDYKNSFELIKSFNVFYYRNGRFPAPNGFLWIPHGDKHDFILGDKISIKQ